MGQGFANAVGLTIAESHLAATFNRPDFPVIDNYIYVFCGDGCLQEGVSAEAASLAGHLGLGKLIVLYDDNKVTIDGGTELSFSENVQKRFEAYGWHTQVIHDGNSDLNGIYNAVEEAKKVRDQPSIIITKTVIGIGSNKQGTEAVHGSPLGAEDLSNVKKKYGFDPSQTFVIPDEVRKVYLVKKEEGQKLEQQWNELFAKYKEKYPELASELLRRFREELPVDWIKCLPTYKPEDEAKATRQFSSVVINKLAEKIPELIGGSADLNPSTLTYLKISKDFQKHSFEGRNIRFGVREHAMSAICNGISAYGGLIPFGSTFFNFIGYALGAVRLSAISHFGVIYIMTHDSIGLGEDGPTHQPINSLMMCRAMPNLLTLRPADGNETSGAYAMAIENRHRPSVIILSRQGTPNLKGTSIEGVRKGAYTLFETQENNTKPDIILLGTGTEVSLCAFAAKELKDKKVRVVSMPSWELFREQSLEYQQSVLLEGVPVLAVEAGSIVGWREYAHAAIAMTSFGASGPYKEVFKKFGFTTENVVKRAKEVMEFYSTRTPHSLVLRP